MSTDESVLDLAGDIRLAIGGDTHAWSRLYEHYRPFLLSAARSQLTPSDLSHSDLVQEAWIRIFSGLDSFDGFDAGENLSFCFFVWLRQVAQNTFHNIRVSRKAKKRHPQDGRHVAADARLVDRACSTPSSIASRNERAMLLRSALRNLKDDQDRQIIQLSIWEGHTLRAISSVIGMEYTKVRRQYQKILKSLQEDFGSNQP